MTDPSGLVSYCTLLAFDAAEAAFELRHIGGVAVGRARGHAGDLAELAVGRIADRHRALRAGGGLDRRLLRRGGAAWHVASHARAPGGHRARAQGHAAGLLGHRVEADGRAVRDVRRRAPRGAARIRAVADRHALAARAGTRTDRLRTGGQCSGTDRDRVGARGLRPKPTATAPSAVAFAPLPAAKEFAPLATDCGPIATDSWPMACESPAVELAWKYFVPLL
ncbi:hypothetical protein [Variovorax sp. UC122_21]|uniref:hypothetical protein n=1 Tax=Variovorax sp. UC122_21 TaxID=3374554 RepID=UPI003756462A